MEDCANGADELNCTADMAQCIGFLCHNFECIPTRWKCDGIPDCDDSSDELNCTHPKKNLNCDKEHGFYQCLTGECIDHKKVCDQHKDCPQGDDEGIECRPSGCHLKNCSQACFVAPDGPECYCREGFVIGSDNITCIDRNECALNKVYSLCSQKCVNLDGSYKCACFEDYQLVNNSSCVVKEGEPLLLFSNSEGIRGLWLKTRRYFPVYHSLKQTVGIDMFGAEEKVFWVDLDKSQSGVYSVGISGDNFEPIITTGLKSPEDLAIDWIGENIYITDAELNKIIVCHLDGSVCASLISNDIDLPRAIVVDPHQGILFWTEWGKHPGIYQSGMDGSNRTTLINKNIFWPNGLAFDSLLNRLYWSEAKYGAIEFYDFETKQRKSIFKDSVFHPFSLAVFEDNLYWSDWITYSLDKGNKFTGHNQTTLVREVNEHIMGVHVYHPLMQKTSYNPCWLHMCSHLCLLAPNRQYSCACPDHLILSNDSKACIPIQNNPFLFVGVDKYMKKFYSESIGNDVMIPVRIPNGIRVGDIAFNWKTQTLYIFDVNKLSIGSIDLQNPIHSYWVPIISSRLDKVEGLTYDVNTNNLYWLELKEGILEVATADGKARTILIKNLDKPIDLVLYPEQRRMYIAVMGSKPHIMVSDMDGENQKVLMASKTGLPISLALDKSHQKLFWADAKSGIIEWMDLFAPKDSDSHHGISKRNLGHVMSIAVFNGTLYWTDMDSEFLYHESNAFKLSRGSKIPLHIQHRGSTEKKLLMAYPEEDPFGPCIEANGGCSHICLLGRFGATCKCPFGYQLQKDYQTCEKHNEMTDNSILCNNCVTNDYENFEKEIGLIPFERSEEEDLNWFHEEEDDEDKEADLAFFRHDSKLRELNVSQVENNSEPNHLKQNEDKKVEVTNEENDSKMEVKNKKSKANDKKKEVNQIESEIKEKEFKVNQNKEMTTNKTKVRIELIQNEKDLKSNDKHQKGWVTLFVAILIIALIVLIIFIILRKDEYRYCSKYIILMQ